MISDEPEFALGDKIIVRFVGDRVLVLWRDNKDLDPGTITSIDRNGKHTVIDDVGDSQCLDKWKEV